MNIIMKIMITFMIIMIVMIVMKSSQLYTGQYVYKATRIDK